MLGVILAQCLALASLLMLFIGATYGLVIPSFDQVIAMALETNLDTSFLMLGVPILGALLILLPVIRLREGPDFRDRFGWRTPSADELVYALATIVPVAVLGNLLHQLVNCWLQSLAAEDVGQWVPGDSLGQIYQLMQGVPYPLLIVVMALGPAVLEEFVFRGVIGRRMVKYVGVPAGILITSLLFAISHGGPAHALATLPIGVLLHLLYLKSGTIWIPVIVHFGNNLLAVSLFHFQLKELTHVSPQFCAVLSCYLVLILVLMSVRVSQSESVGNTRLDIS
ncbi:CPBP family intramembrane glutamic endopeptidase [Planctomicrobium sp. SH668]|uniref:CPBP family intramembrane glutamic endopeptidase n=1 Tax=Planctomicrobium sp. SH668 TaxID=3448126 RepID=UPI003F5AEFC2